eukprot:CAMPEP_0174370640 /NCGR_PEP_ID=MMETSP0811_2-20130205/96819_1 /TAXON_ID=73025 ORGANISM="Eutreptiella gymnastica-like, Strain CCMP1594" /NCGR_SAMPLE_ID=MMETSP0811_2 /ASSEMBLY_ACC=CAM_ASM_000667 /LENGTH=45 /DNA_ID= /DNA_START= /DNA_END= /DNA_ORIENTATION=
MRHGCPQTEGGGEQEIPERALPLDPMDLAGTRTAPVGRDPWIRTF